MPRKKRTPSIQTALDEAATRATLAQAEQFSKIDDQIWGPTTPTLPPQCLQTNEGEGTETKQGMGQGTKSTSPDSTADAIPDATQAQSQGKGDQGDTLPAAVSADEPGESLPREAWVDANRRWRREGRTQEVAAFRDVAREEYIKAHPGCKRREAHDWSWEAAIKSFPPGESLPPPIMPISPAELGLTPAEAEAIGGLGVIPEGWPPLADNSSLQVELGWVQANRLRVVEERGNSVIVHLERATTPAPSMAALGWLETSIRSYAKYVDIVGRALAGAQDEAETTRRERMRLDEIESLLGELRPHGRCPTCGQIIDDQG